MSEDVHRYRVWPKGTRKAVKKMKNGSGGPVLRTRLMRLGLPGTLRGLRFVWRRSTRSVR